MNESSRDGGNGERGSPFAPEDEYFLEIESRFAELRQTPFVFSGRDWSLMKAWRDEGIPLSVVLEAVESCFEARARAPRPKTISSLGYCRHAVRELWNERRNLHVGGSTEAPETSAPDQLAQLREDLEENARKQDRSPVRDALRLAADSVGAIPSGDSVPRIEARLLEIEEELLQSLEMAIPDSRRAELGEAIDRDLDKHKFRDDEIRERTRKANLRRALRKELSIPRLSLFG